MKEDIADIKNEQQTMKQDIADMKEDISALKIDVKKLNERVGHIESSMVFMKAKLLDHEQEIFNLKYS
ncbi:hypothetical protein [Texcoconibacillus texcoconensis]|uniref:Regulator of replication initiation timing n=1 Tax=Texcoconibacillus texcoconensis TaxID=1095777 RepID=A0A840QKK0_9BACI|nr:hypothetical protein [Texcoconibacillus texcoconensis]MBB5171877.1 regulator of replication initiation timing [Texcoconibacillus texcoconensis]